MPIHMIVKGDKQGEMKGDNKMKGREGTILVQALSHTINIPTDPQSGQPVGKRIHQPLMVTKIIEQSSPLLYLALCSGEKMTVTLKWYRQAGAVEEHYFTTTLEEAVLVAQRQYIPNVFDKDTAEYQHMEECSFTYRKIIWTHETEGKQSEDDWLAPSA
jgi:type VI secretion system secreted protein Hcp